METTEELLNKKIGNNEEPRSGVEPGKVKIVSVIVKDKDKNGKLMKSKLLQFMVKHPSKEELITLSKVKYIDGDKAIAKGFWVQTDEENNFYKGSAVDILLSHLKCSTLSETYGKEVDTVVESKDSSYLCLKAY